MQVSTNNYIRPYIGVFVPLRFERGGGCAVRSAGFGRGPITSPILLDDVRCRGDENCLDDCKFLLSVGYQVSFD